MKSNRYQPAAGQLSREQQQVVVKHLDIATAISKRYAPLGQKKSLEQSDLFQEASLGLCLAVLTLQTSDEQQFRKDATKWCMNYVGMAINHERDLDECVDLFYNPPDMALTPGETEEERKSNLAWRERRAERVERMMSVLDPKERQVINMRQLQGMNEDGTRQMINSWTFRGYVTFDTVLDHYVKTSEYLKRVG